MHGELGTRSHTTHHNPPQVHRLCTEGALEAHGFRFPVRQDYEADVSECVCVRACVWACARVSCVMAVL